MRPKACRLHSLMVWMLLSSAWTSALAMEQHVLRDEIFVKTAEGRKTLKYLVSCALPNTVQVTAFAEGRRFKFQGDMGLAPQWLKHPLTPVEARRVSACMLARTNFFGKTVQISISSDAPGAPAALRRSASEKKEFSFFEGGFFGNLFSPSTEAYVCTPDDMSQETVHRLESLFRVCTLPMTEGAGTSRCDFVIVGACSKPGVAVQNGVDYGEEVLRVYLR